MSSVYFTSSIESPLCLFATFRSGDDMHVEFLDDGRRLRLLFVVDSNEIKFWLLNYYWEIQIIFSFITERILLKIQTFRNQPMIKCHPRRTNVCWFWWRHGLIKVSINVDLSATFYGASTLIHFDVQILCANKQNFFLLNRVECSFIEL